MSEDKPSRVFPVLNYRSPSTVDGQRFSTLRRIVIGMAIAWPLVALMSGVASDFVRVPLAKKIAISASATVIYVSLHATLTRVVWAFVFLFVALWMIGVMWFWN